MLSRGQRDGHFQNSEDVLRLPRELWIGSSLKEELMLESEDFFYEIIEYIEIQATCAECGTMTLGILLRDDCRICAQSDIEPDPLRPGFISVGNG